jgi:hypothetical protein
MDINEGKLDPELRRWVREAKAGERTVVVRLAFSQVPEQAAEALGNEGMVVQSCGPGVVVASSDRAAVKQASHISWVTRIELPRRLDMKSGLGGA